MIISLLRVIIPCPQKWSLTLLECWAIQRTVYITESGKLAVDTQTGYIVALYSGVYREKVRLLKDFRKRLYKDCFKIKGGFVGAPLMCKVMAESGMEQEALYFLIQEGYPGWMHCINLGATTI